jgi:SAM-dependent methyltransferase
VTPAPARSGPSRYDTIGTTYTATRRPEPRFARRIEAVIGAGRRVVNVGAGTGSYEPADPFVAALDPSLTMLRQRAASAGPAVLGAAEALPFRAGAFDVALAVLTMHHWSDLDAGVGEMQRVARRQVVFFFEPSFTDKIWLFAEYFPEMANLPSERAAPDLERLANLLAVTHVESLLVPADCTDGFGGCYWNRPEAYLDANVQAGISGLAQLDPEVRRRGTERLRRDLEDGTWDERHGGLRRLTEIDIGYRLLVAGPLS